MQLHKRLLAIAQLQLAEMLVDIHVSCYKSNENNRETNEEGSFRIVETPSHTYSPNSVSFQHRTQSKVGSLKAV